MGKMLVTEGLNKLKTLDSRIRSAINNSQFITSAKTSVSKVTPNKTKEDFCKEAKADYMSAIDLINEREKIKNAIIESNAKTMVEISGVSMSVAKAIDLKSSIEYKKLLLNTMKYQYTNAVNKMEGNNLAMENEINCLVANAYGKESSSIKTDNYNLIAEPIRNSKEHSLVDPMDIKNKIEELERFITEFEATVDSKLQISNCSVLIEIE